MLYDILSKLKVLRQLILISHDKAGLQTLEEIIVKTQTMEPKLIFIILHTLGITTGIVAWMLTIGMWHDLLGFMGVVGIVVHTFFRALNGVQSFIERRYDFKQRQKKDSSN